MLAPIAASLTNADIITADQLINVSHVINSLTGNGSTLREHEIRFTNGDSLDRIVTADVIKDNTIEVTYIRSFFIDRA